MMYEFENIADGRVESFFFSSTEAPPLGSIVDIDNQKWKRVITQAPFGVVKEKVDPFSPQQFVETSGKKKGTVGNLIDQSKELSEKRKSQSIDGRDHVQDKYFDKWSEKRKGKKHPKDDR